MQTKFLQSKIFYLFALITLSAGTLQAQTKPVRILQNADSLISRNTTWDCDTVYYMKGKIYVVNGATLNIQPGTVIVGDTTTKGILVITKGAKINAVGTPQCPIVFTSAKANPSQRRRGDWGGVIILGRAKINTPTGTANIEGLPPGPLSEYGGGINADDNDNSGALSFVRIEFPGVALSPNNEVNGLTMGGVGRGTFIDYVQVSYSNDDSFEWFGGTVNAKHLIAFRGIDDDFDVDFGYTGKVQFAIGMRDPLVADVSGSGGFETDNDGTGSSNLPQTRGIFSNVTISAGGDTTGNPNFRYAMWARRNTHLYLYNSILMGYPTGIYVDGTATNSNVQADTMFQNNIVVATQSSKWVVSSTANAAVTNLLLNNAANRFYTGNVAGPNLRFPYRLNNPDFRPNTGSPALTGSNFTRTGLNDPFFTRTPYVGAVNRQSAQNWAQLWVNWVPTATDYTVPCLCATNAAVNGETFTTDDIMAEEIEKEINVYPNPARGNFKIDLSGFTGKISVKVTNMNGALVYSKTATASSKTVLDVVIPNAATGYYFVTVSDGKNSTTKKINITQ